MAKLINAPTRFPNLLCGVDKEAHKPGWVRTYPKGCDITDPHDGLAQASGAYHRWLALKEMCDGIEDWRETGAFTKKEDGRWVEDLSGVSFGDVDVVYLDYVCGTNHLVARWIASWADTPEGKAHWNETVYIRGGGQGKVQTNEQFDSLGNYMLRRDQKTGHADLDGFCPDDGWVDMGKTAGRTLLRVEYIDRSIPDPTPFSTVGRELEWSVKGRSLGTTPKYKALNDRVRSAKEKALIAEGAPEDWTILVPVKDSLRTLKEMGLRMKDLTKTKEPRVGYNVEFNGRTYFFGGRWLPANMQGVDLKGEKSLIFHDRWLWADYEASHAKIRSLYHGLKSSGFAALKDTEHWIEGKSIPEMRRELEIHVRKELTRLNREAWMIYKLIDLNPGNSYYESWKVIVEGFGQLCRATLDLNREVADAELVKESKTAPSGPTCRRKAAKLRNFLKKHPKAWRYIKKDMENGLTYEEAFVRARKRARRTGLKKKYGKNLGVTFERICDIVTEDMMLFGLPMKKEPEKE